VRRAAIAIALAALCACGDDIRPQNGGGSDSGPGSDAPPVEVTLTTFVIDLVTNQTADNTEPKPFSDFSALPDPDGSNNNVDAYKPLFP
jgi:hypothetical protein